MDSWEQIVIEFGVNTVLPAYKVEGKIYYPKGAIADFLGLAKNWAGRNIGKETKTGKYLESLGYADEQITLNVAESGRGGVTTVDLISGEQLTLLLMAGAMSGSATAISLLGASFNEVRVSRERDALGLEPLRISELKESFDEYRKRYYQWFAASLSDEEWKVGDVSNPTPDDVAAWASKVQDVYQIQAAPSNRFVVEKRDRTVDYEAMLVEYD